MAGLEGLGKGEEEWRLYSVLSVRLVRRTLYYSVPSTLRPTWAALSPCPALLKFGGQLNIIIVLIAVWHST